MDSTFENVFQLAQRGFRVAVGAVATFSETLQDPQQRSRLLSQLNAELGQRAQEWEGKGEFTEREARRFVENLMQQQSGPAAPPTSEGMSKGRPVPTPATPLAGGLKSELQMMTDEVVALRAELEKLRAADDRA
ncbi:hypothetical protein KR51_00008690 [Rubidibacter lacunae KORDI 51-2]|uniref:Uncharacterized protein n=1 Tax=Rubidibacter lacunae KORDI 51-2 TaxID=582515 RepID=U5DNW3_9CHRO|nr:hypothetical protein [Rubidibacter lacunae]ERN42547.1 hypothetical protein KR51_00008690 [Rubidibacter lacunae KORDI 51-2]